MCGVAAALTAASALIGYKQSVDAAEQQASAYRAQAEADERNARYENRKQEQIADNYANESRQLRTKARLAQGAQRAQAGAANIDFSGSQMDLFSSSQQAYQQDQQTLLTNQRNDNFNSRVAESNFINSANAKRAAADNVVSNAKASLVPTLLSTAGSIVGISGNSMSGSSNAAPSAGFGNATKNYMTNSMNTQISNGFGANMKKYNMYQGKKYFPYR